MLTSREWNGAQAHRQLLSRTNREQLAHLWSQAGCLMGRRVEFCASALSYSQCMLLLHSKGVNFFIQKSLHRRSKVYVLVKSLEMPYLVANNANDKFYFGSFRFISFPRVFIGYISTPNMTAFFKRGRRSYKCQKFLLAEVINTVKIFSEKQTENYLRCFWCYPSYTKNG